MHILAYVIHPDSMKMYHRIPLSTTGQEYKKGDSQVHEQMLDLLTSQG